MTEGLSYKRHNYYEPIDLTVDEESDILGAMCLYCTHPIVIGDTITAYPLGPLTDEDVFKKEKGEPYKVSNYCLHQTCALIWQGFPLPEPVTDMSLDRIMIPSNVEKWESYMEQSTGPRKTMIDIGCHDGQYIRAAFFEGFESVLGVDIGPDFFNSIKDWKAQYYPNRHLTLINTRIVSPLSLFRVLRFFGCQIDFLKMDIEGNEYTCLGERMGEWSPRVSYMNVELHEHHPMRPEHGIHTPDAMEAHLQVNGWRRLGDRPVIDSTWKYDR